MRCFGRVSCYLFPAILAAGLVLAGGAHGEIAAPPFSGLVVDRAGLLGVDEAAALTRKLEAFEAAGLGQMAILTVPSLEGEPIERFGMRVAETWKPGSKKTDDGLILIVARDEREMRIEVGYGLEGVVPDARAGDIIRQVLVPAFRDGRVAAGMSGAIDALARLFGPDVEWAADAPPAPVSRADNEPSPLSRAISLVVVLIIVIALNRMNRGGGFFIGGGGLRGGGFGGGGFGGGGFGGGGGGRFGGGGASGRW